MLTGMLPIAALVHMHVTAHRLMMRNNASLRTIEHAPHGIIAANNISSLDPITARRYFSLFKGKAVLSKPVVTNDEDLVKGPRVLEQVCVLSLASRACESAWACEA